MTHRLHRMLLINARTSGAHASGLITEVNPCDGAAVIGNNSVGKTTTLELFPLFFGHLPSQIGHTGGGRETLLRYVLPTPESAIVFEYQRGPSPEHDLRLAVLRRRDGEDSSEYRFFQGGFRRELFVSAPDGDEGQAFFLDDDASVEASARLGIAPSRKLSSAHYRHVILGMKANNKESVGLRQMSTHYSFGPVDRPLANLDKLVAAVVKSQVSFQDFIAVTVDMVQQELGAGNGIWGSSRDKVQIKEIKGHLTRWLAQRDACANALAKSGQVDKLRQLLTDQISTQALLGAIKGQVIDAVRVKREAAGSIHKEMLALQADRQAQIDQEQVVTRQLDDAHHDALERVARIKVELDAEQGIAADFQAKGAQAAEAALLKLPSIKVNIKQLADQIAVATDNARDIDRECTRLANQVNADAATQIDKLKQDQSSTQGQQIQDLDALEKQHRIAEDGHRKADAAELNALQERTNEASAAVGEASVKVERPSAQPETIQNLDECQTQLNSLNQQNKAKVQAEREAQQGLTAAQNRRQESHAQFEGCVSNLRLAQQVLATAQEQATPIPGSVLDLYQKASDKDRWRNLVRILRPDVIHSTILNPTDQTSQVVSQAGEAGDRLEAELAALELAYGWELNLHGLRDPDWTNPDWGRDQVTRASTRLAAAQTAHTHASQQRQLAQEAAQAAQQAHDLAKAALAIHEKKIDDARVRLEQARDRQQRELAAAVDQARPVLEAAQKAFKKAQDDLLRARQQQQAAAQLRRKEYDDAKGRITLSASERIAEIEKQIRDIRSSAASSLGAIEAQRIQQMREKGVDVTHVKRLESDLARLEGEQRDLEKTEPLVSRWQQWRSGGGQARLDTLRKEKTQADSDLTQISQQRLQHKDLCGQAQNTHNQAYGSLQTKRDVLGKEVGTLEGMLSNELDRFQARAVDTALTWVEKPVDMFQKDVSAALSGYRARERNIENDFARLRNDLTAREGAIKDLVEAALAEVAEEAGTTARATKLVNVFLDIRTQVVPNINTSLRTALAEIGQFRKKVSDFASEVTRFNTRLQAGMVKVSAFPWLSDLSLHIRTNFDDLGFMGSLKGLDEVIRNHALSQTGGTSASNELPPGDLVSALRDFVSLIQGDGTIEINLASHVIIQGGVTVKGVHKTFKRESDIASIDSTGLTTIVVIALLSGMLNMIRGHDTPIYVPWAADEVGKFDPGNFASLMRMLKDNRIDVVTASPVLGIAQQRLFARRYNFTEGGGIAIYAPLSALPRPDQKGL